MIEKLLNKKLAVFIIIIVILIGAFLVRTYNFHDWLYFKMDQSRDAQLVSHAITGGLENLPLLGPRAGATDVGGGFLRLGPAYYYFQYAAGAIFNSTAPEVFAFPDLFFSILAIILLYFFVRIYFSRGISLAIIFLYSFSFLIIEYSRFAWNPNALQFFTLLTFFGLLKFLNEENFKRKIAWLSLWALGISIGSQLHFFALSTLSATSVLLIFFRGRFWKLENIKSFFKTERSKYFIFHALIFLGIVTLIYSPVIASDIIKNGENSKNFLKALTAKPKDKPLTDKILRNIQENVDHYCLITTSFCGEGKFKDHPLPTILTIIFLVVGLIFSVQALKSEKDKKRRDFLLLLLLWFGVFFILTIPVSYQLRPRFFILVFAVPFIFAGIIFNFFLRRFPDKFIFLIFFLTIAIFGSNLYGTLNWFREQKDSQKKDVEINYTLILKNKDGVTLGQLERVVDFMYEKINKNNELYFYVKPEHVSPIKYLLAQKKDPNLTYSPLSLNENPNAQYFAVIPSHSDAKATLEKKYKVPVEIKSEEECGQVSVYEIDFPKRLVSVDFRYNKSYSSTDRLFWRDVFRSQGADIEKEDETSMEDINMNE